MIFVIGDIHGMLDPIKNLIQAIEAKHKIDKLIFLGDYIDYGPSSKEVIDYIISLKYDKIFLAGNHEDLLLQFYNKEYRESNFSKSKWLSDYEGNKTLRSFLTAEYMNKIYIENNEEYVKLECRYTQFFDNLNYIYYKSINNQKFIFSHGNAKDIKRISIEKMLKIDTFEKFHNFLEQEDIISAVMPIWNRADCVYRSKEDEFKKIKDYIVIHGHTPVITIKGVPEVIKKDKLPYIEIQEDYEIEEVFVAEYIGEESIYKHNVSSSKIYGINIDTGVVFGEALTALGIDEDNTLEYRIVQVRLDKINKSNRNIRYSKYILEAPQGCK